MAKENQAYLESVEGGSPPLVDGDGGASTVQSGAETTEKVGVGNAAIAIGLSIMQQLSGVNAVIYYAPHLYTQLGVKANIAILIAGLNSVAQVGMTKIMTLVIDSLGRRTICLVGLLGMFFGLTSLAVVFQSSTIVGEQAVAMAVGGILIFRLSFSLSLGPLPYIMVTELFPQRQRARGAALSMMTNWILNWFVVFMIPEAMSRYKGGVFFAFAVVCVISAVVVDLWLPETSGRNLEDIDSSSGPEGVIRKVCRKICCKGASSLVPSLLSDGSAATPDGALPGPEYRTEDTPGSMISGMSESTLGSIMSAAVTGSKMSLRQPEVGSQMSLPAGGSRVSLRPGSRMSLPAGGSRISLRPDGSCLLSGSRIDVGAHMLPHVS